MAATQEPESRCLDMGRYCLSDYVSAGTLGLID